MSTSEPEDRRPVGNETRSSSAKPSPPAKAGILGSLVRVESLIQMALLLPTATFVGWAIGLGLDHWLHQHWIYLAGLILGAVAGFVQVFRLVSLLMKE
jgi:ATP synthase protein I